MNPTALILDHVYDHEAALADQVLLTQPQGDGTRIDFTWAQTLNQARRMATHLKSLGLPAGARVAMLAKNSAHFVMAELAIWMAGCTTVAIFPTETAANVRYVLEHCEASLLFIGKLDGWAQQQAALPDVLTDALPCITLPLSPAQRGQSWDSIVQRTPPMAGRPQRAAADLAMILYTSGSTGQPKGVMQTFGSISAVAQRFSDDCDAQHGVGFAGRALSYLPLAHAYERAAVMCFLLVQGHSRIFFADSLASFMDDLKHARPTGFVSVPRLWLKFQQAVLAKLPQPQLDALLDNSATAAAVQKQVLAGLGLDAALTAYSASAPVSPQLLQWYRRLGLNLLEGYGMTEDFAYSHLATVDAQSPGYVGRPRLDVQARLANDGEVLVKSPGALLGYYKLAELTAQSFTADGFFCTGDLGEYNAQGELKITGRKKELFKTAKGKFVAPSPIENRLNAHPMLELSMVSGVGRPAAYALVQLAEHLRPRQTEAAWRAEVQATLQALLEQVNANLAGHEELQMLVVAGEAWSMDNGCLTPTMKIKRSRIEATVQTQLDGWYAADQGVVWA